MLLLMLSVNSIKFALEGQLYENAQRALQPTWRFLLHDRRLQ